MNKSSLTSAYNQRGFTLLEILIAITLLAFITIGVVSITDSAIQTKDRTTEINKNNLQIETAMSRFEWDFSQIYSPLYFSTVMNLNQNLNNFGNNGTTQGGSTGGTPGTNDLAQNNNASLLLQQYNEQLVRRFERNEHFIAVSKEGFPIPRFYAPDKSTFEFFTSSNRRKMENTKQSHYAWVRYALAQQEALPDGQEIATMPKSLKSLVRYYTADDPYGDKRINIDNETVVKGAVLLRNVESLEFQFWDLNRRKWETSLRSVQNGESLLHGIKMIITWYDSAANKKTSTRIFRTHWPLVAPQDATAGTPSGTTTGTTNGGTSGGNTGNQGMGF